MGTSLGDEDKLDRILKIARRTLRLVKPLSKVPTEQEWYSVEEFAKRTGKRPFTIRQHCNLERLNAEKRNNGREWVLSHAELLRYRREGLLPIRRG